MVKARSLGGSESAGINMRTKRSQNNGRRGQRAQALPSGLISGGQKSHIQNNHCGLRRFYQHFAKWCKPWANAHGQAQVPRSGRHAADEEKVFANQNT